MTRGLKTRLPLAPVLAVAGFWFNNRERKAVELRAKAEQEIASDNQREAALQAYINGMSELLLHENLRDSKPEAEVRKIARVRTLTVLPRLDSRRKGSVLQFLYESGLIDKNLPIIDLTRADLSGVYLIETNLRQADLSEANLCKSHLFRANLKEANLIEADLSEADLRKADLRQTDLSKTFLSRADLSVANLKGAIIAQEQLDKAKSLQGATMPDGKIHS